MTTIRSNTSKYEVVNYDLYDSFRLINVRLLIYMYFKDALSTILWFGCLTLLYCTLPGTARYRSPFLIWQSTRLSRVMHTWLPPILRALCRCQRLATDIDCYACTLTFRASTVRAGTFRASTLRASTSVSMDHPSSECSFNRRFISLELAQW